MPTVRIPSSLAIEAITGAAPVPVPPPIPAVMNSIWVFFSRISLIRSILCQADSLPTEGNDPAPSPLSPNWILVGTGEDSIAWASVLQIMKSTPLIP